MSAFLDVKLEFGSIENLSVDCLLIKQQNMKIAKKKVMLYPLC